MLYTTDINDRPWKAIKNHTKKVEVRTNTKYEDIDYSQIAPGDHMIFINNKTSKPLTVKILSIRHYKTVKDLLQEEGPERTLSSGKSLKEGVSSILKIKGYTENIPKYGVYALTVKPID
jgi:ASC-1-like (ASCH) protein